MIRCTSVEPTFAGVTASVTNTSDPTMVCWNGAALETTFGDDTQFGRTLVVKIALVLVVIALSGSARRALKQRDARNLRTTVAFEAIVALVVIALTGSLTGLSPKVVSSAAPFQQTIVGSEVFVTLAV
ncbi:MAG: hypothetical protein EBZ45_01475, partial [Actinobacteria bacterium]|nr:hypothetical protein [Actinomycetota bacterium]